jgi:hypothetical protein
MDVISVQYSELKPLNITDTVTNAMWYDSKHGFSFSNSQITKSLLGTIFGKLIFIRSNRSNKKRG